MAGRGGGGETVQHLCASHAKPLCHSSGQCKGKMFLQEEPTLSQRMFTVFVKGSQLMEEKFIVVILSKKLMLYVVIIYFEIEFVI